MYFAYGYSHANISGLVTNSAATAYVLQHTGRLILNAYSGGGYWTPRELTVAVSVKTGAPTFKDRLQCAASSP